jgi:D-alanine-D-alanine ligase
MFIPKRPVVGFIRSLAEEQKFEVFFNLCDGLEDSADGYSGMEVVRALEELNLPFTGADSRFYDPSREEMQSVAEANGVGFARGVNVTDVNELDTLTVGLRYPLMVKHPNSYASTAMTRNSRVDTPSKLREQVRRICNRFGSARVEEFIDGREFTVLVADDPDDPGDPYVYPPGELIFPPGEGFLHSHVKWKEFVYMKPVNDRVVASGLREMVRTMYLAMDGVGYARCDIRMDSGGRLFMIEINPNSGILFKPEDIGPADVVMEYDAGGHAGFLDRIFRAALVRHAEKLVVSN